MSSKPKQEMADQLSAMKSDPLLEALKERFGFSAFQPGQRAVISSVLSRRPTLAVMPTGAGKSLCYQLPALMSKGLALVISPLISLMKDQVDSLRARGVAAYCLNSSLSSEDFAEVMSALDEGRCELLYVAPERFRNERFLEQVMRKQITVVAVDEAHCISQWGHDFRPEYAKLGEHLARLDYEMLIACTATATPRVQEDILRALRLSRDEVAVHVAGFLRPNLFLEAKLCRAKSDRQAIVKAYLKSIEGAVILYANTQRLVEEYAQVCASVLGDEAVCAYHGGMSERIRTEAQDRFMNGAARVVVATNAFGMGVDRGDVRAVLHVEIPRTVEAYYQEVGRAGRDGEPAQCLLLYGQGDRRTHEFLINQSHPDPQAFVTVWESLDAGPKTPDELQRALKRSGLSDKVDVIARYLRKERLINYNPHEELIERSERGEQAERLAEALDLEAIAAHRDHQLKMHDEMFRLAQSGLCRHAYLLTYFGEDRIDRCPEGASCDRCEESRFGLMDDGLATGELSQTELNITLKALSGISRAKGYYGSHKVAAMLCGVARAGAEDTFLAKLPTWGVLSSLSFELCLELINYLMSQGMCEMSQKTRANGQLNRHKSLQITPIGLSVCLKKRDVPFRLKQDLIDLERRGQRLPPSLPTQEPRKKGGPTLDQDEGQTARQLQSSGGWRSAAQSELKRGSSPQASSAGSWRSITAGALSSSGATRGTSSELRGGEESGEGQTLASLSAALKRYRLLKSRELQVPAYTIFSDATLALIVSATPKSRAELLAVKGVGPRTWAQFGLEVLEIIREQEEA